MCDTFRLLPLRREMFMGAFDGWRAHALKLFRAVVGIEEPHCFGGVEFHRTWL